MWFAWMTALILAPLRPASHSGNAGGHMTQAGPFLTQKWYMDPGKRELSYFTRTARLGCEVTGSIGGHFPYNRRSQSHPNKFNKKKKKKKPIVEREWNQYVGLRIAKKWREKQRKSKNCWSQVSTCIFSSQSYPWPSLFIGANKFLFKKIILTGFLISEPRESWLVQYL